MKYRSKKILLSAFSLPEVAAALIILALVSSGVLVVINRCMVSASNLALRMQAFEVARENMEKLLASESVSEMAEFGNSDEYPQIQWQTVVETFYEPITARMWIQAVCSAEYTDTAGDVQAVELTHWLTDLTKKQLLQIIEEMKKEKERLAEQEAEEEEKEEEDKEDEQEKEKEPNETEPGISEPECGYTLAELFEMPRDQALEILRNCDEF